ncbi:GntR family transcriptional regulator [Fusobacterium necrophorum DAB]|uniref:UTRA domain-containing protein n=1 Tax=Fusobacterium necrophorum TaxID=859 RepID=UPI000460E90D|nr:UTRA domain-containing protein [Fusobacterium necrophorum]KDE71659.1 GntR family transcriptional regulator [Fusobacterium necrophorum DAB]
MSKYIEVYQDIKKKIENGEFKRGEELVSETELSTQYSYSKDTIRKSLSLLEMNGYIQKIKGKNSKVLGHGRMKNTFLGSIQTSQELNQSQKYSIQNHIISLEKIPASTKLMEIFSIDSPKMFYKVIRSRSIDGEHLEFDVFYFDQSLVPKLTKKIVEKSIYEYLENHLNLKISHSRREIFFRYATEEEKKYMDLKNFDMVAVIESVTYLSNGSVLQYGTTSYRPDKFSFISIAKRNK